MKTMKMGIIASVVAVALTGCGEAQTDTYSYYGLGGEDTPTVTATNPSQCEQLGGGTLEQCEAAFKDAKAEHLANAPKFSDAKACEAGTDATCVKTQVTGSDGSISDVFIPAMVGMIVGQMMANNTRPMPVYAPAHPEDRKNGFVTAGGAYVPAGKGSVGANTFVKKSGFSRPLSFSKPTLKSSTSMVSKGGFGKSGSFGSSGG